jgi:hypothetical protein
METVPFHLVIDAAAYFYGIGRVDLCGKSHQRHLVLARHLVWWIGRKRCGLSLRQIGDEFGVDHSSVLCAVRNLAPRLEADEELLRDAEKILAGARRVADRLARSGRGKPADVMRCEKPLRISFAPTQKNKIERRPTPLARIEPDRYEPGTREWFFINDERFKRGALKALREGGQA